MEVLIFRRHTLAYLLDSGRVYAFGLDGSGQLGLDSSGNKNSPFAVHYPFVSSKGKRSSSYMDTDGHQLVVKRLAAGGDHCFVFALSAEVKS